MITELEVVNFQSHQYSYLEFVSGVNIIRGTSNHGKSALIRAILWALENEPRGAEFRNWHKDAKEGVEVHVAFPDGVVSRINRTGFNGYLVANHPSATEEEFEALRGDVPIEARSISNMDRSNIHGQDDGYFLLQESPGNIARKLNERAGLEDIDRVSKITKAKLDDLASELKHAESELEKKLSRRSHLYKIKKHKQTIEDIDDLFRQLDISNSDKKQLENSIEVISEIEEAIQIRKEILKSGQAIKEVSDLLDRRLKVAAQKTRLTLQINMMGDIERYIQTLKDKLASGDILNDIGILILERGKTVSEWSKLDSLLERIMEIENEIRDKMTTIDSITFDINELSETLDNIGVCPTCGAEKEYWKHEIFNNR